MGFKTRLLWRTALVALACTFLDARDANATTYFVREQGDDDNGGVMPSKAWRTLTKAARTAKAGDTVIVGAGTFVGQLPLANSGTNAAAIVFIADTEGDFTGDAGVCVLTSSRGSLVILDEKSHIHFRGFSFQGASGSIVNAHQAAGIWFHGCEFFDAASTAVRLYSAGSAHFSRCIFRDNSGLAINAGDGVALVVDECSFEKNAGGAIKLKSDDCSLRITQSRLIGNAGIALELAGPSTIENCLLAKNKTGVVIAADKSLVLFCTIVDQGRDGCVVKRGEGVVIANSIVVNNRGAGIRNDSGEVLLAHNLVFSNRTTNYEGIGAGPTDLKAPPLFDDDVDYRLKEKSPAINAAVFMDVAEDRCGSHRPLGGGYDIGCHEFVSSKRRTTYYVRRGGDDTDHGSTAKHAWATLGHAAKTTMAGDTIYVGGGVYEEQVLCSRAATAKQPIRFIADTRGKYTGDRGQVTIIAPDEESWACRFVNADHTQFVGFRFAPKSSEKRQGVYLYNSNHVGFEDCTFDRLASGIVAKLSRVSLNRVEVRACKPRGVSIGTGRLTATASDFVNNHTGLHAMADAACVAMDCKFDHNSHTGACLEGKAVLAESSFEDNGMIGLWTKGVDSSLLQLDQLAIRRNKGYGWLLDQCDVSLTTDQFEKLHLQNNAVSVAVLGGVAVLDGAELGGSRTCAVVSRRADLTLRNCRLGSRGTALHLEQNPSSRIEACNLQGDEQGVGILWSGGDALVKNCVITNFATGIRMTETDDLGELNVWNCTLANVAEYGIESLGGDLTLRNSIVSGRKDSRTGLAVHGASIVNHSHNLLFGFADAFEGTEQHTGEATTNPRFVAADNDDYRLSSGSPAINAGMDAAEIVDVDITGNARPSHGSWEIGAHEYLEQGGSFRVLKWEERR